jgi:hypothetical protein
MVLSYTALSGYPMWEGLLPKVLDLIRRNRNIMCIVQRSTKRTEGQLETCPHTPRYEDSYWDSVELHLALVGSRMTLL